MLEMTNSSATLLLTSVVSLLCLLIVSAVALLIIIKRGFLLIVDEIKQSIIPKSLKIEPSTNDIADLAIELWRLDKRLLKTENRLSDDENKALRSSAQKIKRFVQKNDVEVIDYTGQAYNEGMNLDIILGEKDPELKQSIIYETHEPAVTHKGVLIRKAKVIIHEK